MSQMWRPFFFLSPKPKGGGSVKKGEKKIKGLLPVVSQLTDASGSVRAGDEASWTGAHVAAGRVGALPSVAHARDGAALVDVCGQTSAE